MKLREAIDKMVNDIVEERFQNKKKQIEALNFPPDKYQKAIEKIKADMQYEYELIDLSYEKDIAELDVFFEKFFDNFFLNCLAWNDDIPVEEAEKIFLSSIELLYRTKLKILDSSLQPDFRQQLARVADIKHENARLVMWSQAQEKASLEMSQALGNIFKPVLKDLQKTPLGLFTREGVHRAVSANTTPSDHPLSYIFGQRNKEFFDLFMQDCWLEKSPHFALDRGLYYILWSALSSQYVLNSDRKSINIYLPDSDIATSSTFWNYELSILHQLNLEAGGKINFYKLNNEAQKKIIAINKSTGDLQKKLDISKGFQKIKDNFTQLQELDDKIFKVKSTLSVIEIHKKFESHLSHQNQRPIDLNKMEAYLDQELKLKKELHTLNEKFEEIQNKDMILRDEYNKACAEMPYIIAQINNLQNEKNAICALAANWETIPFEQLQFKGIKMHDKPFTVQHLMHVGEILKQRLDERRHKKIQTAEQQEKLKLLPLKEGQTLENKTKRRLSASDNNHHNNKNKKPTI